MSNEEIIERFEFQNDSRVPGPDALAQLQEATECSSSLLTSKIPELEDANAGFILGWSSDLCGEGETGLKNAQSLSGYVDVIVYLPDESVRSYYINSLDNDISSGFEGEDGARDYLLRDKCGLDV